MLHFQWKKKKLISPKFTEHEVWCHLMYCFPAPSLRISKFQIGHVQSVLLENKCFLAKGNTCRSYFLICQWHILTATKCFALPRQKESKRQEFQIPLVVFLLQPKIINWKNEWSRGKAVHSADFFVVAGGAQVWIKC